MVAQPNISFSEIRSHQGSQHRAFEEVCYQLRWDLSEVSPAAKFVRHGTPDGGLEFLANIPGGETWGWQAKYLFRLDSSALTQLDRSVKRALSSHPDLTRYTFCLPFNLPAGAVSGKKSARKKWGDRVRKWIGWAGERGMSVEFSYVGESELLQALTKARHAGTVRYWFDRDVLTQQLLQERLDEVLETVGPRYTRELHVDLPIAHVFEGLCRSSRFHDRLRRKLREVRKSGKHWGEAANLISSDDRAAEIYQHLQGALAEVDERILALDLSNPEAADLPGLATSCSRAASDLSQLWDRLRDMEAAAQVEQVPEPSRGSRRSLSFRQALDDAAWHIRKLDDALADVATSAESEPALAVNTRALFVVGEAGTGKTHLFCDVARRRIDEGFPAILLLGQHFGGGNLWGQILEQAEFKGRPDEFLGALEAAAQAAGGQALLCIDALNEAADLRLWHNQLPALLEKVRRFPRISVALACRTGYAEDILPGKGAVRVEHRGFASKTPEAVRVFFSHYGLSEPDFPLTLPEAANPLFLKLMCRSLSNQEAVGLPRGLTAVTSVFAGFLHQVEARLARRCDYPRSLELVRKAVDLLAKELLDSDAEWMSFERAWKVTQELLPGRQWTTSLLSGMIDEGVLMKDRSPPGFEMGASEIVRFAYQRLGDHECARCLCEGGLSGVQAWLPREPEELRRRSFFHGGWFEALAIQLPERFGVELHELVPDRSVWRIQSAFLQSLIWRSPEAINLERCLPFLREISRERDAPHHAPTLDALLQVAPVPNHPLNARFLHAQLEPRSMPRRDALWSIYVHGSDGEQQPLARLISWAESEDTAKLGEEAALLSSCTLAWCFSTSNRRVRDRATKALVRVLRANLQMAEKLLDSFSDVDDPYVLERVLGAIYGALLMSRDKEAVGSIAGRVYKKVFEDGGPPVHLMIRDYAAGIVEWGLEVCGELEGMDRSRVEPPYESPWPIQAPKLRRELATGSDYRSIRFSVTEWDFHRYVIEPVVSRFLAPNQARRQREERRRRLQDARAQEAAFENCLTREQRELRDLHEEADSPDNFLFQRSLNEGQGGRWISAVFASRAADEPVRSVRFDVNLASRWIANRVVALGWKPELFLDFDRSSKTSGRHPPGGERIGKKYQWIALHELLARLSDHCQRESWDDDTGFVEGLWELEKRDIDPSYLLEPNEASPVWPSFQLLVKCVDKDEGWVRTLDDCAPVRDLIALKDSNGVRWLALESYPEWREEPLPEVEPYSARHRRFWYQIRSYLMRQEDLRTFLDWQEGQRLYGRWMPEAYHLSGGFLGEYPWHPSTIGAQQSWSRDARGTQGLPVPMLVTASRYSWSVGRDFSGDEPANGLLLNAPILRALGGIWAGAGLRFVDSNDKVVAWDPSGGVRGSSAPSCLLVDHEAVQDYLREEGLTIVWTVLGEKIIHPGGIAPENFVRGDISGAYYLDGSTVRLHSLRLYGQGSKEDGTYRLIDSLGSTS